MKDVTTRLNSHEIDTFVNWVMYNLGWEESKGITREALATNYPQIYNKLVEKEIFQVTRADNGKLVSAAPQVVKFVIGGEKL